MSYLDLPAGAQAAVWDATVRLAFANRRAADDIGVSPLLDAEAIRSRGDGSGE